MKSPILCFLLALASSIGADDPATAEPVFFSSAFEGGGGKTASNFDPAEEPPDGEPAFFAAGSYDPHGEIPPPPEASAEESFLFEAGDSAEPGGDDRYGGEGGEGGEILFAAAGSIDPLGDSCEPDVYTLVNGIRSQGTLSQYYFSAKFGMNARGQITIDAELTQGFRSRLATGCTGYVNEVAVRTMTAVKSRGHGGCGDADRLCFRRKVLRSLTCSAPDAKVGFTARLYDLPTHAPPQPDLCRGGGLDYKKLRDIATDLYTFEYDCGKCLNTTDAPTASPTVLVPPTDDEPY